MFEKRGLSTKELVHLKEMHSIVLEKKKQESLLHRQGKTKNPKLTPFESDQCHEQNLVGL